VSGYDGFAPIYDRWAAHMTDDVGFYVDLARQADGPVVELAVGTGRVAIPITERTGQKVRYRLVAGDARGRKRTCRHRRPRARPSGRRHAGFLARRAGRARHLPFPLAAPPLHVGRPAPRVRAVAAALGPGGRFAWNAFVYDFMFAARHHGILQNDPVPHVIEHIPSDNRIDITVKDGPRISLWWISRGEWEALLDVSGLETDALYGWFDRRPFDEDSREFVWVARKPAS